MWKCDPLSASKIYIKLQTRVSTRSCMKHSLQWNSAHLKPLTIVIFLVLPPSAPAPLCFPFSTFSVSVWCIKQPVDPLMVQESSKTIETRLHPPDGDQNPPTGRSLPANIHGMDMHTIKVAESAWHMASVVLFNLNSCQQGYEHNDWSNSSLSGDCEGDSSKDEGLKTRRERWREFRVIYFAEEDTSENWKAEVVAMADHFVSISPNLMLTKISRYRVYKCSLPHSVNIWAVYGLRTCSGSCTLIL